MPIFQTAVPYRGVRHVGWDVNKLPNQADTAQFVQARQDHRQCHTAWFATRTGGSIKAIVKRIKGKARSFVGELSTH